MRTASRLGTPKRITRADIESKLRQLRGDIDDKGEAVASTAKPFAVLAVVGVIGIAFLLGQRRGRKRSTVVEIRRV